MSFIHAFSNKKTHRHWLYIGRSTFCIECPYGKDAKGGTGINLDIDGDEDAIVLGFGIHHLFKVYVSIENLLPRKLMYKIGSRFTGIDYFEGTMFLDFLHDGARYKNHWYGWHGSVDIKDVLCGKSKYSSTIFLQKRRMLIPFPEGQYPCSVEIEKAMWTRKRFVKPEIVIRYNFYFGIPVPESGKGENDWDQGDDAVNDITIPANSLEEAVDKLMIDILNYRHEYGGENWKPKGGFKV